MYTEASYPSMMRIMLYLIHKKHPDQDSDRFPDIKTIRTTTTFWVPLPVVFGFLIDDLAKRKKVDTCHQLLKQLSELPIVEISFINLSRLFEDDTKKDRKLYFQNHRRSNREFQTEINSPGAPRWHRSGPRTNRQKDDDSRSKNVKLQKCKRGKLRKPPEDPEGPRMKS